ncbi:MAG: endonuclease/exonuclease/phosphatase family protein [Clostridia bacterium]|nr:endonuclease/exonuclease/phosphatase family protein [Clostridia bacterium]
MKLKVMTYNIAGGRDHRGELPARTIRPEACGEVIAAYSPDIVGLNEIDFNHPRSGNIHLAADVAKATGIPYENRFGRATELGRPGARGSYGNAFLSKHPILLSEALQVPDPEDKSEPTYYETRGIFRNIVLIDGKEIEVLVTHFGLAKTEHAETMKMLTKFTKERTRPIIIMGDFNVWGGAVNPEYNRIDEIAGHYELLKDTFTACPDQEKTTFPSRFDMPNLTDKEINGGKGIRIDYIFVSEEFKVTKAEVPESRASDHLPYYVELELD